MLKKVNKLIGSLIAPVALLAAPAAIFAAGTTTTDIVPANTLGRVTDPLAIVRGVIQFILIIAFVAAFIMLLIGGIRWITAGGDEKGVASARNMITGALIGLVVVLVAYAMIRLVEVFFGFNIITGGVTIPTLTP
jgi:hypothetical protein